MTSLAEVQYRAEEQMPDPGTLEHLDYLVASLGELEVNDLTELRTVLLTLQIPESFSAFLSASEHRWLPIFGNKQVIDSRLVRGISPVTPIFRMARYEYGRSGGMFLAIDGRPNPNPESQPDPNDYTYSLNLPVNWAGSLDLVNIPEAHYAFSAATAGRIYRSYRPSALLRDNPRQESVHESSVFIQAAAEAAYDLAALQREIANC